MLSDACFTLEWIQSFRGQRDHSRIDPSILEKMIYALHLLERLRASGLDFTINPNYALENLLRLEMTAK